MKLGIENLFIDRKASIREAMQTISAAAGLKLPVGIVLVVNRQRKLEGVVTDGDIRKAVIKDYNLCAPVEKIMIRDPITVNNKLSIDDMIATVMRKVKESDRISDYKVDKVVVVDEENKVIDVLNFYDLWYHQEARYKKICIIGTGHVGLTLLVMMAEAGYQIIGFDIRKDLVRELNKGKVRFYEKGLQPLLNANLKNGTIRFTTQLKDLDADVYIICVGTPVDNKLNKPMLSNLKAAILNISKLLKKENLIILRSTVPIGTTREIVLPIIERESGLKAGTDFYLVFAPERAAAGNVLAEIKEIPQIIGGFNKKSTEVALRVLELISPSIIVLDALEEAEMVKLINNTFRDHSFAFANKIAIMCDKLALDAVKLIKAANEGYPRNPVSLPSPGVGGYCLHKDSYLMAEAAKRINIDPEFFVNSRRINDAMPHFVSNKVLRFIEKNLASEKKVKIYILGFAFKGYPETSDMRNSPTLDLLKILQNKLSGRGEFFGYDPVVKAKEIERLGVKYINYEKGFKNAHCVLIMNNNPDFSKLDIFSLFEIMKKPGFFFDGWHFFLDTKIVKTDGITYLGLGGGF